MRSADRNPLVRSHPRQVHTDLKYQADLAIDVVHFLMLKQMLSTTHNLHINVWVSAKALLIYRLFYYASEICCLCE